MNKYVKYVLIGLVGLGILYAVAHFLKQNDNAVFAFKITQSKVKGSFSLKSHLFDWLFLVVGLIFSIRPWMNYIEIF